jgi:hypothetical protein
MDLRRIRRPIRQYLREAAAAHDAAVAQWYGSQGPASAVRCIDPVTGEVTQIISRKRV